MSMIDDCDTIGLRHIFTKLATHLLDEHKYPFTERYKYLTSVAVEFAINNRHKHDRTKGLAVLYFRNTIDAILVRSKLDPSIELLLDNEFYTRKLGDTLCLHSNRYGLHFTYDKRFLYNMDGKSITLNELEGMLKQANRNEIVDIILT